MVFTFLPFSAFAANTASTGIAFDSPDFALEFPDAEFRRFLGDCCDTNYDGKLDVDIKTQDHTAQCKLADVNRRVVDTGNNCADPTNQNMESFTKRTDGLHC